MRLPGMGGAPCPGGRTAPRRARRALPRTHHPPHPAAAGTATRRHAVERIGIIGVGEIARAIVEGLSDGVAEPPRIHLSPRGAATAAEPARRYPNAQVRADNQDVADRSDVLILAVRPQDAAAALPGLRIGDGSVVVSAIAGIGIDELRGMPGTDAPPGRRS